WSRSIPITSRSRSSSTGRTWAGSLSRISCREDRGPEGDVKVRREFLAGGGMMATQTSRTGSGLVPYRLTVRQFLKMIEANIFPEIGRASCREGVLIPVTVDIPQEFVVMRLADVHRARLPTDWATR